MIHKLEPMHTFRMQPTTSTNTKSALMVVRPSALKRAKSLPNATDLLAPSSNNNKMISKPLFWFRAGGPSKDILLSSKRRQACSSQDAQPPRRPPAVQRRGLRRLSFLRPSMTTTTIVSTIDLLQMPLLSQDEDLNASFDSDSTHDTANSVSSMLGDDDSSLSLYLTDDEGDEEEEVDERNDSSSELRGLSFLESGTDD